MEASNSPSKSTEIRLKGRHLSGKGTFTVTAPPHSPQILPEWQARRCSHKASRHLRFSFTGMAEMTLASVRRVQPLPACREKVSPAGINHCAPLVFRVSRFCTWQQGWPSLDHTEVSLALSFLKTNLLKGKSAGKSLVPRKGVGKELFCPALLLALTGSPSGWQQTCSQNHACDGKF